MTPFLKMVILWLIPGIPPPGPFGAEHNVFEIDGFPSNVKKPIWAVFASNGQPVFASFSKTSAEQIARAWHQVYPSSAFVDLIRPTYQSTTWGSGGASWPPNISIPVIGRAGPWKSLFWGWADPMMLGAIQWGLANLRLKYRGFRVTF